MIGAGFGDCWQAKVIKASAVKLSRSVNEAELNGVWANGFGYFGKAQTGFGVLKHRAQSSLMVLGYNFTRVLRVLNILGVVKQRDYCARRLVVSMKQLMHEQRNQDNDWDGNAEKI